MNQTAPAGPLSRRESWSLGLRAGVQVVLSIAALGAMYVLVPAKGTGEGSDLPWLLLELGLFAFVVAIQVPAIIHARYPILRAAVALGVVVPFYLLAFSRVYLSSSLSSPDAFTQPLDHASAFYFTVTVFATVGFGDITADTDAMRLLVTAQMLVNLIVVGAVIRLLVSAARRGVEQKVAAKGTAPAPAGEQARPSDEPSPS